MLCFLNAMKMIGSPTTSVGEGKIISTFGFFTKITTTFIGINLIRANLSNKSERSR